MSSHSPSLSEDAQMDSDATELNSDSEGDLSQHGDNTQHGQDSDPAASASLIDMITQEDSGENNVKYYLVGIELFNFKSYQGHHTVGPFTELTAIIGPNGSGKSNLMDAISFALCIKSNDKIRVNRLSDLVNRESLQSSGHSSSTTSETREKASVKLIFMTRRNTRSTKTLCRFIQRDGTSRFKIDDALLPNKEPYIQCLNQMGIDAKSKIFLLFQGTVDSLITKNPKEFSKYLEEICGSIRFEKDYNITKNKFSQVKMQVKILDDEKKDLAKQSRSFRKVLEEQETVQTLKEEIQKMKFQLDLINLHQAIKQIEHVDEQITENQTQLEEMDLNYSTSSRKMKTNRQEFDKINKDLSEISQELRHFELTMLTGKTKSVKNDIANYTKGKEEASRQMKYCEQQLGYNSRNKAILDDKIKKLTDERDQLRKKLNEKAPESQSLSDDYRDFLNLEEEFNKSHANENIYNSIKKEIELLKKDLEKFQDLKSFHQNSNPTKQELCIIDNEIAVLDEQLAEKKNKYEKIEKECDEFEKVKPQKENDIQRLRESKDKSFKNLKRTKKQKDAEEFLQKLKKLYPGKVYGRFSSIFRVSHNKYKKAANKGCLHKNAIVVDSLSTVQHIVQNQINDLKLYSEQFVPLDSVRKGRDMSHLKNIRPPLSNPRLKEICLLSDVVQLTDEYKNNSQMKKALNSEFGHIIWCPDDDTAKYVAYHLHNTERYNTISEAGTYFHADGSISASFDNNSSQDLQDLDFVSKQLQKATDDFDELQNKYKRNKIDLKPLAEELTRIRSQIQRKKDQKNNGAKKGVNADSQKLIGDLARKIEEIEKEISAKESLLSGLSEPDFDQSKEEFFREFLERKQCASVKEAEQRFKNPYESDLKHLSKLDMDINKKNEELNSLNQKLAETEQKLKRHKCDHKKFEELLEKAKEESNQESFKDEENRIAYLKGEEKRLREKLDKSEAAFKGFTDERDSIRAQQTKMKASSSSLKNRLAQLNQARHNLYKKAYLNGLVLPFTTNTDGDNLEKVCTNKRLSSDQIYEIENQMSLDFSSIEDLVSPEEDQQLSRNIKKLETDIAEIQNQIPKVTLPNNQRDLKNKIKDIKVKIKANSKAYKKAVKEMDNVKKQYCEVKEARRLVFMKFFEILTQNLDNFYKDLTDNASAQAFLIPENHEEPYLAGIQYSCMVPGKVFQPISALSGGEKCLAAFAFIFSCYAQRFPCFFILDELDGALDNPNILKLIKFIQKKANETQFILISHKPELFGKTNSLIGVCRERTEDSLQSKTFSLDLTQFPSPIDYNNL